MKKFLALILVFLFSIPEVCFAVASSASFNDTNSEFSMGNNLNVTTGDVSTCAWVKPTEDASSDTWVMKKNGYGTTGAGYGFKQNSSNDKLSLEISDAVGSLTATDGTLDPDGLWTYICFRWDATGGTSNTTYGYENGSQVISETGTAIGSVSNAVTFYLGRSSDGTAANFSNGLQFNAVVWTTLITVNTVLESQWFPERSGEIPNGLWFLWGNVNAVDISGNGLTGTAANISDSTDGPPYMFGDGLPL